MELIQLNLGCGSRKLPGYVNIDIRHDVKPDVILNVERYGLSDWEDNSVDKVRAWDFLEHIRRRKVVMVIEEIWRVLKPGGVLEHNTPSTDGRGAFQDPTHRSYWNYNSWMYFTIPAYRAQIETKANFRIIETKDILTSGVEQVVHTYGLLEKIGA